MALRKIVAAAVTSMMLSSVASAQEVSPELLEDVAASANQGDEKTGSDARRDVGLSPDGAKGFWFYLEPKDEEPEEIKVSPKPEKEKPEEEEDLAEKLEESAKDPCEDMETWEPSCGFVKPDSFEFQEKQRDALLKNMVMNPHEPESVEAVQRYTRWVIQQATYGAQVWQYNSLQDEELNAQAQAPISQFGLEMANEIDRGSRDAVWDAINRWGGFLVYFSKTSCDYCHKQLYPLQSLSRDTGIPVYNASLEGDCMGDFEGEYCLGPEMSTKPAEILQVDVVPAVFLYLPDNVWIRVSMGLSSTETMRSRLYNFFLSWRLAAKTGETTGDTGMNLNPDAMPKNTGELQELLMAPKPTSNPGNYQIAE